MENQSDSRTQKIKINENSSRSGETHSQFSRKNSYTLKKFNQRTSTLPSAENIVKKLKNVRHALLDKTPWFFLENQRHTIYNVTNFSEFSEFVLTLEGFERYDSCQILIHKKGNPYFLSFNHQRTSSQGEVAFDLKAFNQIFNSVKKSKAKVFNQTSLESPYLDLVGHFMAKEIEFKNFNVLFLLSMNSFVPNTKEDIKEFDIVVDFLSPYIQLLCEDISQREHYKITKHLFQYFPFGLEVYAQEKLLFRNQFFDSFSKEECTKHTYSELSSFNVYFYIPSKFSNASEVHHFQRVSLLGELLNTLQHELSNPLFGIKLASDILKLEAPDEDTSQLLFEISQSAQRSQGIISTFSSLYQDNETLKKIALTKLIEETITLTKSETKQIPKHILNQFKEEIYVDANPSYLTQIVFNLIVNSAQAIKQAREDYRHDRIDITLSKISSKIIRLTISDTGPGIKDDSLDKVFKPFFTTKATGTGLGLSICQALAEKMGTTIYFENNKTSPGVTFWLDLTLS